MDGIIEATTRPRTGAAEKQFLISRGDAPDGRKVKATLHWVSAARAVEAEVRLYDTLITKRDAGDFAEGEDWKANLNPKSIEVLQGCKLEPCLKDAEPGSRWQFERMGYFCADSEDSKDVV